MDLQLDPRRDGSPERAKKQSKWSQEEDAKIIQLRNNAMKWEDISKYLPGRSPTSCRLRHQNYLVKKLSWDEDRKTMLAKLYKRYVECITPAAILVSSIELLRIPHERLT